ncbi:hypothetical protein Sru01_12230 [Sphaerisporangium rufum]|uniref:Uncharacterized protein n=1 Tax=Sphaerisporangium rufum TaxID=1381558 RepID=A0A919UWQ0_9ACTN|nr:hypothetical protein [Sphaerisporangium rufum]GII76241.1 hypothetical protein Sru01_12230 [Sphaerisporangium rufum]
MKRRSLLLGGLALPVPMLLPATAQATARAAGPARTTARLTSLAHLDFLRQDVRPPDQQGHTTYRLAAEPRVGMLWTYAEPGPDGTFRRVGGGAYDAATDTWGQGAYNADDVSRAAVVYLRHWRLTGAATSRDAARGLLRGLTYLQTATGPDAGNVVLWMQPDGTLNPSPTPKELPDPSDSDASYWLARTIWALGEGYAAWRRADAGFAAFLRERLDLAIAALDRQVLARYGEYLTIDGERAPAWLIADGADASAEAALGLAAYVEAGGGAAARRALLRLAEGIAALSDGDVRTWPFGALRPWALSRSVWHAWGAQMPAGLARAAAALRRPALARPAVTDAAGFTPWLLTSGGPDNGRQPTPADRNQIAYGADSRVQSLLAVGDTTGRPGFHRLAAVAAAWFFGANASGRPAYDPATGRTVDGIAADGTVNRNSGAESTIHGLLTMLALDARPEVAALARRGEVVERDGCLVVEAETGTLSGEAAVVAPEAPWTGESLFSGSYVRLGAGGGLRLAVPAAGRDRLVLPVADLRPGSRAVTTWRSGDRRLGEVRHGRVGEQGDSPAPGALLPVTLAGELPAGATELSAAASGGEAVLDAVLLEPLVSRLVLRGGGRATTLLRAAGRAPRRAEVRVPGGGAATAEVYGPDGVLRRRAAGRGTFQVDVLPGGFTLVQS